MEKIVINALQYKKNSSGIGIMIRDLFSAFCGMTERPCQVILAKDSPDFNCAEASKMFVGCRYEQGIRRMLFQTFVMGIRYCRNSVLLTVDSKIPLLLPKSCKLIPIVTDLAVFRLPEAYQFSRVLLWRLQYRLLLRRADRFLAISEFTKKDLMERFSLPEEKISVVPCACETDFLQQVEEEAIHRVREKYALPGRFVLFVGNCNPRKNLRRLLEAFDKMKTETSLPHELLIVGEQGWKFSEEETLHGLTNRDSVRFLGYIPDEDMPALYAAAELFAFPSLYEGFGIPVLEAQSCGTPVLTGNCTSLPEVGGDGAIYADPYSVEDISEKMKAVLTEQTLAESLREKGLLNVRRFSWEKSAEILNQKIKEIEDT